MEGKELITALKDISSNHKTFKEETKKEFSSVREEISAVRKELSRLREDTNQRFRAVTEGIEDTNRRLGILTKEVKDGFSFLPKMLEAHEEWLQNHEVRIQKFEKIA